MPEKPSACATRGTSRSSRWRLLPLAVLLGGCVLAYGMGWHERLSLQEFGRHRDDLAQLVASHRFLAPAVYVAVHATAVAISLPVAALLTAASGFLFGWFEGACYAIAASLAGGTALFLAARSALGEGLRKRARGWLATLADGFEADAFAWVFILRLVPIVPFAVASIVPALLNVRARTFLAATVIGMLPGSFAYAWLGHGLERSFAAALAAGRDVTLSDLVTPEITVALLALALVAVLAAIVRRRRSTRMP